MQDSEPVLVTLGNDQPGSQDVPVCGYKRKADVLTPETAHHDETKKEGEVEPPSKKVKLDMTPPSTTAPVVVSMTDLFKQSIINQMKQKKKEANESKKKAKKERGPPGPFARVRAMLGFWDYKVLYPKTVLMPRPWDKLEMELIDSINHRRLAGKPDICYDLTRMEIQASVDGFSIKDQQVRGTDPRIAMNQFRVNASAIMLNLYANYKDTQFMTAAEAELKKFMEKPALAPFLQLQNTLKMILVRLYAGASFDFWEVVAHETWGVYSTPMQMAEQVYDSLEEEEEAE